MATKKGVETLVDGTRANETKIILRAGTFNKITDAVQKVMENDKPTSTYAQMFSVSVTPQNQYKNPNTGSSGRGHFQNYRGNVHSSQRYRGNFNNFRGNYKNRGNRFHQARGSFYHRGSFPPRGHFNSHQGMFFAQNIPQQNIPQHLIPQQLIPQQQNQPQFNSTK